MTGERMKLAELENREDFIGRHIGPRDAEIQEMLQIIGVSSLDELMDKVVPQSIRMDALPDIDTPKTEGEALARLRRTAERNRVMKSFIGQGYYGTITPPVILRNVLENPGWYTAYTPYQPEISQGRLEALLNFQQVVIDLTGMDLANASLLDEGTAAAEAMTLAHRSSKSGSDVFLVDKNAHPQTIAVIETRAEPLGIEVVTAAPQDFAGKDAFGIFVQYPDSFGEVPDLEPIISAAKAAGQIVTVATDLLALTIMTPPGEFGADIVIGSAQRFGVPMGYGGPHAAFFATRDEFKRSVPGRIVGVSVDRHNRPALRLALQTREQHIRREKATSNICTAQVLLANMAGFYAVWHGPRGLKRIGERVHRLAAIFAEGIDRMGLKRINERFFDTVTVQLGDGARKVIEAAREVGYNMRDLSASGCVSVAFDECSTIEDVEVLWGMISGGALFDFAVDTLDAEVGDGFAAHQRRSSGYLSHPVFNSYRSETEMLRYLHRLEQKDIALNRSMIPLGSCTMKLNATSEMIPVTWPEFANIHPFAPLDQARGYAQMIEELEVMLAKLTGFAAVSLQPNAGSQGEYAGLLTIRAYHKANGQEHRNICLIPSSAHGTNPASAVLAGMKVVVVKCDENGNVDLDDLRARAEEHKANLAALMVTYPSTHGVFEEEIRSICDIVHEFGGQVYLDGANLNAMLGLAQPGEFGADVMHMNLHKTFCIPHGGGGPGVGPIGVAAHLADYLPGHPFSPVVGGDDAIGAVSAAPWGSASILPISWVYIVLMGAKGLKKATEVAILNANYLAARLKGHFDVLYTGRNGMVAHECILDTRAFKRDPGVSVDDIAKRLMDFGFHAPTMSFPVPDTLMVEPTESESKAELDRFAEALIAIRREIAMVADGTYEKGASPLHNAPHTLAEVTGDEWPHSYSRSVAAFPAAYLAMDKYFPPVARVDNAAGDRNLVCTCPAPEAYMEAEAAE